MPPTQAARLRNERRARLRARHSVYISRRRSSTSPTSSKSSTSWPGSRPRRSASASRGGAGRESSPTQIDLVDAAQRRAPNITRSQPRRGSSRWRGLEHVAVTAANPRVPGSSAVRPVEYRSGLRPSRDPQARVSYRSAIATPAPTSSTTRKFSFSSSTSSRPGISWPVATRKTVGLLRTCSYRPSGTSIASLHSTSPHSQAKDGRPLETCPTSGSRDPLVQLAEDDTILRDSLISRHRRTTLRRREPPSLPTAARWSRGTGSRTFHPRSAVRRPPAEHLVMIRAPAVRDPEVNEGD